MFGRKKKLLENGALAQAVITEADAGGYTDSHGRRRYKLLLDVTYPDGSTAQVSTHADAPGAAGAYIAGESLPVRYDLDDPSKLEIDVEKYRADRMQGLAESRERLMRAAESRSDDA